MSQSATEILHEQEQKGFYGSLEIKLEAGRVVLIRKTETIRPTVENYRISRGKNDANPQH